MKILFFGIAVWGLLLSVGSLAAFDRITPEEADHHYQQGNCHKALRAYWIIQQSDEAPRELRELALFRTGYCLLQIQRPADAAHSFGEYLRLHPEYDEARLRYAQAYFQDQDPRRALANATQVVDGPFFMEAMLLAAQAELELGRDEEAFERLKRVKPTPDWRPAFLYWTGVAKYHLLDYAGARFYFLRASAVAPPDHWVRQEVQGWLERLREEDRRWHGTFVLGYIMDSNVGQESIITTDSLGSPTLSAPTPGTYYHDSALYVGAELDYLLHQNARWAFTANASVTSSFYETYKAYSSQNLATGLTGVYRLGSRSTIAMNAKYLDSRYAYNYYQDFLLLDPVLTLGITNRLYATIESSYTFYLFTRSYHSFALSLSLRYNFDRVHLFGGVGYQRARGTQATYYSYSSLSYLYTGESFNNYETASRYLGATLDLPWSMFATGQISYSSTHYDTEAFPSDSIQFTSGDREDRQTGYSIDVGRTMIPNLWTLGASYNYTMNRSSGQQGLVYSEQQVNYNYNRSYLMLKSTLTF